MGRRGRQGWEGTLETPSKQDGGTQPGVASPQVPLPEATSGIHLATPLPMPEPATDPLGQSIWSVSSE